MIDIVCNVYVRLPSSPVPTHDEQSFVTLADAIDDLHNVPCETGRVQLSDDSFTFNHVASKPRKCSKNLRLDEPVNTMTTQNTFYHPLQRHRTLSIRELARLFDLPDNKQFFGSFTAIQKQIGNSVRSYIADYFLTFSLTYTLTAFHFPTGSSETCKSNSWSNYISTRRVQKCSLLQ